MKEIILQVPEGKKVEWVNDVLTLVDEQPKDITERIKTFENACEELGEEHELVKEYWDAITAYLNTTQDLIAYLKLRIIVAALNEGWEPQFTKDEYRYYPWFCFYTKEQYDKLDDENKGRCVLRPNYNTNSFNSFVYCITDNEASYSKTFYSSRLALKTYELATYAGRQFIEEYADFIFKPCTNK